MENLERISAFYEGNLSEFEEKNFFAELSSNNELRSEFKAYNSLVMNLESSVAAFTPSQERKNRLFAKAGFELANDAVPAPLIVASSGIIASTFLAKIYSYGILHSIFASLITAIAIFYFFDNDEISQTNKTRSVTQKSHSSPIGIVKNEFESSDIITKTDIIINQNKNLGMTHLNNSNDKVKNSETNDIEDENSPLIELQKSGLISLIKTNVRTEFTAENAKSKVNQSSVNLEEPKNINFQLDNWEVQLVQSIPWNFAEEEISPKFINRFNNSELKLIYIIDEKFKLGFGIEQSTFYTEYMSKEGNGSLYKYKMQPNLTSFNTGLTYSLTSINDFTPSFEFGLGVNKSGFLLKPAAALKYELTNNVSLISGVSYDIYRFTHQNNWFTAYKLRLNYGVSVNF